MVLHLDAAIPLPWQRDLVDDLPADDVEALVSYLAELAFGEATSLRTMPKLDLALSIDARGNEEVAPVRGWPPNRNAMDRAVWLEIYSTCSRWMLDHADWLSQHITLARYLVSVGNPAIPAAPATC